MYVLRIAQLAVKLRYHILLKSESITKKTMVDNTTIVDRINVETSLRSLLALLLVTDVKQDFVIANPI